MAFMYYGKKYDTKAELKAAQKKAVGTKGKKKIGNIFEGRLAKEKRAAKTSVAQGKRNQAATSKMYAAESMFKSAKSRDDAKVAPGKARSFKQAFDAATKAGKERFMLKGKSYLTTKGKRADRFDPTKIKAADKKESTLGKFKSSKTLKEFFGKIKKKK